MKENVGQIHRRFCVDVTTFLDSEVKLTTKGSPRTHTALYNLYPHTYCTDTHCTAWCAWCTLVRPSTLRTPVWIELAFAVIHSVIQYMPIAAVVLPHKRVFRAVLTVVNQILSSEGVETWPSEKPRTLFSLLYSMQSCMAWKNTQQKIRGGAGEEEEEEEEEEPNKASYSPSPLPCMDLSTKVLQG